VITTKSHPPSAPSRPSLVGQSVARKEDPALLTGHGRFIDDLSPFPNTHHAAILRSSYPHARIVSIDADAALAIDGVVAVVTGRDVERLTKPFSVGIETKLPFYACAIDKVHYVGEPVAVVIARDRYIAEDALEEIVVEYDELPPVVRIEDALRPDSAPLHESVGSNVVHRRSFVYGDVDAAFAAADEIVEIEVRFPKYGSTPIETYGVIANFDAGAGTYVLHANFHGPFVLHPVMAAALKVPGNHLRLHVPPDIGGSYGIKALVYPYMVLLAVAARIAGVPVRWIEDRLEHLQASSSSTDRLSWAKAAVKRDGTILALALDQVDNVGAYVRAPEPACLYRMHGTVTGAYRIPAVRIENRLVTTNKLPTGLNRGYGGQEQYFTLERLVARVAKRLGLSHLDVVRRNLLRAEEFPYNAAAGSIYDAGDYTRGLDTALRLAGYDALVARREEERARGKRVGIGIGCIVEPSGSNMGYVSIALPREIREGALPKSGCTEAATIAIDPLGGVTVRLGTTPQGQGHQTVAAQIVAQELGVDYDAIEVIAEIDTQTSPWSIASGSYSSRFAPVASAAIQQAAQKVAAKLRAIAAQELRIAAEDVVLAEGKASSLADPSHAIPVKRIAGLAHWHPVALPPGLEPGIFETAYFSLPILEPPDDQDKVDSSAVYGFIADVCYVEIDPQTGRVQVQEYVSVHDCGRMLNPLLVEGQIRGGFAHGIGGALFEEMAYADDGTLLAGTFADYLIPTATEVPPLRIGHENVPSPFTPLGAKGVGEGNSMSVPVVIANAVADALELDDVTLPLTPHRVWSLLKSREEKR
jgi:2-furoyl-CoA dehydrogenase large subunit